MERFDHFMARANSAYYARGEFNRDFCTAPELTQVFGELLGGWAKIVWQMMGAPEGVILAEAGPGRGTLMADALRVWRCPHVHLIETSVRLRAEQATRVPNAVWHDDVASLPTGPLILLANEFLDALPVRQFVRHEEGWCERFLDAGAYIEQPTDYNLPDDPVGSVREVNEAAIAFCEALIARNAVALFIDYGPLQSAPGESVQAIRNGKYADPLASPGAADITAHVDFASLANLGFAQGPIKLNAFLTALGLHERTDQLARNNPDMAENLRLAARRLTAPEAMGSLFKVLALCPKDLGILPGFA